MIPRQSTEGLIDHLARSLDDAFEDDDPIEPIHEGPAIGNPTDRILGWLTGCELFSGLSPASLQSVANHSTALFLKKKAHVFEAGQRPRFFHLLVLGRIGIFLADPVRGVRLSEFILPGQCFGEVAVLLDEPYPITGEALAPSLVIRIPMEVMLGLMAREPLFCRKLMSGMSRRILRLMHDLRGATFKSAQARLADLLLQLAKEQGTLSVTLPASKGQIASKLMIAQPTLSRFFSSWQDHGAIRIEGKKVHILKDGYLFQVLKQGDEDHA